MMRNQRGDALPGIVIAVFLVLVISPILYNFTLGDAREVPEVKIPPEAGQNCIEEKSWMRGNHMQLLMDWRDSVVREGNRTYKAKDDKEYRMSITGECLNCHSNKEEFCDRCHDYLKVKPYCWDCHIVPPQLPKEDA